MAKRNDLVNRARGRKPAPVRKPVATGLWAMFGGVFLFCALLITYGALNVSAGDKSSLKYAQGQIDGLDSLKNLSQKHTAVGATVNYPDAKDTPPVGGEHNPEPQSCQVYTAAIANEHAVHSLEHGAVWVTYNPDKASKDDIAKLKEKVDGNADRLMSPYPGLKSKISLQAWGERVFVDKVSDPRVDKFLELFTKGPQTKEVNGACVGTTSTGPINPAPAPAASPTPKASAAATPSASASPK